MERKRVSKMDPELQTWQTANRMFITREHNGISLLSSTNLHRLLTQCQELCLEDTELSSLITSTSLSKVFIVSLSHSGLPEVRVKDKMHRCTGFFLVSAKDQFHVVM